MRIPHLPSQSNCISKHRVSFSATQSCPRYQVLRNAFDWWKKSKGNGDWWVFLGANSSVLQRRLSGRDSASTWPVYLALLGFYCLNHWWILKYPYNEDDTALQSIMAFVLVSLGSGMGGMLPFSQCWLPFSLSSLLPAPQFSFISLRWGPSFLLVQGVAVHQQSFCDLSAPSSLISPATGLEAKGDLVCAFVSAWFTPSTYSHQMMVMGEHSVLLDPFNTFLCRSEISVWSSELLKYEWQFCLLLVRPSLVPSETLQSH